MDRVQALSLVLLLQVVGCGPIGPIPGGRLSGELGPRPSADWRFAEDEKTAQLETRPEDPHSVNTWFVSLGPDLYVPTSMILGPKDPTDRTWVTHVVANPMVRIRLGDHLYERVAIRVTDAPEYDRARDALETKYGIDRSERDPEREIWIFRLDARAD